MASRDAHGRLLTIGVVESRDGVGWDDIDPKSAMATGPHSQAAS